MYLLSEEKESTIQLSMSVSLLCQVVLCERKEIQLLIVDPLARASMKSAGSCDTFQVHISTKIYGLPYFPSSNKMKYGMTYRIIVSTSFQDIANRNFKKENEKVNFLTGVMLPQDRDAK